MDSRRYSKRFKKDNAGQTLERYLEPLKIFAKSPVICVDGMNGTGKSTMILSNGNRAYRKINEYCPTVTSGSDYNFYIMNALQYINYQILNDDYIVTDERANGGSSSTGHVWDRDRYSNLRFYFIHYLMYECRNVNISAMKESRIYEKLNTLAVSTHLIKTLTFFEKMKKSPPTLIMVCSNMEYIGRLLLLRGGVNGTVMSKNVNYHSAQYHVYNYFAKILQQPVVDIYYVFAKFSISMRGLQYEILKRIDYYYDCDYDDTFARCTDDRDENLSAKRRESNSPSSSSISPSSPSLVFDGYDRKRYDETFMRLQNFCKNINDRAIYTYSLK